MIVPHFNIHPSLFDILYCLFIIYFYVNDKKAFLINTIKT
jgi:hypothetical protein